LPEWERNEFVKEGEEVDASIAEQEESVEVDGASKVEKEKSVEGDDAAKVDTE